MSVHLQPLGAARDPLTVWRGYQRLRILKQTRKAFISVLNSIVTRLDFLPHFELDGTEYFYGLMQLLITQVIFLTNFLFNPGGIRSFPHNLERFPSS